MKKIILLILVASVLLCAFGCDHQHSWDSGVITKQATCEDSGAKVYTCTECGAKETINIQATGHDFKEKEDSKKEATFSEQGETVYKCSICGQEKTEYTERLPVSLQDANDNTPLKTADIDINKLTYEIKNSNDKTEYTFYYDGVISNVNDKNQYYVYYSITDEDGYLLNFGCAVAIGEVGAKVRNRTLCTIELEKNQRCVLKVKFNQTVDIP